MTAAKALHTSVSCEGLESWSGLDQANGLLESARLRLAVGVARLDVVGDEVAAWLDLQEVGLDGISVRGGVLQVLLVGQLVLLGLRQVILGLGQQLLVVGLLLFES